MDIGKEAGMLVVTDGCGWGCGWGCGTAANVGCGPGWHACVVDAPFGSIDNARARCRAKSMPWGRRRPPMMKREEEILPGTVPSRFPLRMVPSREPRLQPARQ